ncbi:carbohydrate kinase family protein [Candidatus Peribacteria bacterium]|nr:carbohydrate kinase family protein [Candidatus Peribacteria bacterium]
MSDAPAQPKRKRTLSIGGATYDLFVQLQHLDSATVDGRRCFVFPLGEKMLVQSIQETCGGGASNSSVGLARLGCQAAFCGILTDEKWGQALLQNFQKEGVDTRSATIVEDEVSSFSIILSASCGERTILYEPGANRHLHDATFSRETAKQTDWVYLSSLQEGSGIIRDDIVEVLTNDDTINFTWNPGGHQIAMGMQEEQNAQLVAQTDLLLLNEQEALQFTGKPTGESALHALTNAGAKYACITNGAKGVLASDGIHLWHCPALQDIDVIDTTGAGDAFGTGATWAFVEGRDLQTALRAGTINAASVVGKIGAQAGLLTDTEMRQRLEATSLEVAMQAI